MRSPFTIADEAVSTLERLRDEAMTSGHTGLAAFLNRQASLVHWNAPTLPKCGPDEAHKDWLPTANKTIRKP